MHSFIYKIVLFAAILLFSCSEQRVEWSDDEAGVYNNKELLKNVVIYFSDSGKIQIKITAPKMIRHTDDADLKEEFPDGFLAYFYDANQLLLNTMASKYAIRVNSEQKTYMRDSVVFHSPNQETIRTSELIWDERNGRLYTDKYVRIIRNKEMVQGYGFETDERFRSGTIKAVDAIIPSEKLFSEEDREE
ncbi:MAG: LPS export ABC transporter periplasmic protein LptC [Bacteroidota bacterium]|nr:LPS export ABC transporter periplasmic protein LptC [Bacteroidota bacterium]